MPIAQTIININNKKIELAQKTVNSNPSPAHLNCNNPDSCPLENDCTHSDVIYSCTVTELPSITTANNLTAQARRTSNINDNMHNSINNSTLTKQLITQPIGIDITEPHIEQHPEHLNSINLPINEKTINTPQSNPKINMYIGLSSFPIKTRISNHLQSSLEAPKTKTTLSNLVRNLKENKLLIKMENIKKI